MTWEVGKTRNGGNIWYGEVTAEYRKKSTLIEHQRVIIERSKDVLPLRACMHDLHLHVCLLKYLLKVELLLAPGGGGVHSIPLHLEALPNVFYIGFCKTPLITQETLQLVRSYLTAPTFNVGAVIGSG